MDVTEKETIYSEKGRQFPCKFIFSLFLFSDQERLSATMQQFEVLTSRSFNF